MNNRSKPNAVVVDTAHSDHATLQPVPVSSVRLHDDFWAPRLETIRTTTIPTQYELLESTGRLDNFRRAAGNLKQPFQGLVFNDSDVYKWLEAAAWALAAADDPALSQAVDTTIELIAAAQHADGYLNTYFSLDRASERWSNLRDLHELYCAGHLFQAAVAHVRATGHRTLLDVATRFADLICDTFGPGDDQQHGVPGHPEIEMALVELARATGEQRYLKQAAYFLDARGRGLIGGSAYHQDHAPLREQDRLVGHAVRAAYLCAGATDLYAETGEPELGRALDRLWRRMLNRQMYITGGLGPRHQGEAMGADFELPNARAYAETCAGIANAMWAWRMLQIEGAPTHADVMERALYNAVLPGISLDGTAYFYVNPLATDGAPDPGGKIYQRQPWFPCACCPPNVARTLATLPGFLYSVSSDTVWIHHYAASQADLRLGDGRSIQLLQRTRYPWDGQITVEVLTPGTFALNVRIPGWCATEPEQLRPTVNVNSIPCPGEVAPGQYVELRRTWAVGDSVCLHLPMPVQRVSTHPYALENSGRVALMRGPLLYCLEQVDHPGVDLRDVILPDSVPLSATYRPHSLNGIEVIEGSAAVAPVEMGWQESLYRTATSTPTVRRALDIVAIPYFAWANREVGAMQVWLRRG